jgi:hypothetical protein
MNVRVVALVAPAAAMLVVFAGTASAFGTVGDLFPGTTKGSWIAFTSFRDGSFDLYVMNADGRGPMFGPHGVCRAAQVNRDGLPA